MQAASQYCIMKGRRRGMFESIHKKTRIHQEELQHIARGSFGVGVCGYFIQGWYREGDVKVLEVGV